MSQYTSATNYTDLMKYLDDISADLDPKPKPSSREQNRIRDDQSTISDLSNAPLSTPNLRTQKSSPYIWDNFDDDDMNIRADYLSPRDKQSSYSKLTSQDNDDKSNYTVHSETKMKEIVNDLKEKVRSIRQEVSMKIQRAKELQTEWYRLSKARAQRAQRAKQQWDERFRNLRAERDAASAKQTDLSQKVTGAIRDLEVKLSALRERLEECKESNIDELEPSLRQARSRAKAQWLADEDKAMKKVYESKVEAMRQQAASVLGPALDEEVKALKVRIREREVELDLALEEKRSGWARKAQADLQILRSENLSIVSDLSARASDTMVALHAEEIETKRSNNRKALERRKQEAENALARQKDLFDSRRKEILDAAENTRRAYTKTHDSALSTEADAHRSRLRAENSRQLEREETLRKRAQELQTLHRNRQIEQKHSKVRDKLLMETVTITERLDNEAERERASLQQKLADQISIESSRLEEQTVEARQQLQCVQDSATSLNEAVADLSTRINTMKEEKLRLRTMIERQQDTLKVLRADLTRVEESEGRLNERVSAVQISNADTGLEDRCAEEIDLENIADSIETTTNQVFLDRITHHKTYLQQVEEKITRVYDLKATRIDYARNELDRLQHERQDLEDRLQLLRQTQLQASA